VLARFEPRIGSIEDRTLLVQQVAESRAALQAAEIEHQRAERLLAERAVPARRVEDAARALAVAQAQLTAADARLANRDETLRSGGGAAGGNTFDLRAPIAGTIVSVSAAPGAGYAEGVELFRIVRTNLVVVEAQVPASGADVRGLVTGLALELPGRGDPVALHITREADAGIIDPKSRALLLRFEVDNPAGLLLVGQAGTAVRTAGQCRHAVVPASAILTEAGRPFLFLQVGGERFEKRFIELGARDGDRVAVVTGLASGDRVVTRGAYEVQLASAAKGLPAEGHVH
jgi:RND family efflux transporter MFP subunit